MIVILAAYLVGWLFAAFFYTPLRPFEQFPEIARGHTCVHLDQDNEAPAYMVLERGEPIFYDLWTNRTIGSYYTYTNRFIRSNAFKKIRMTSPVYWQKTLYQVLTEPKPFNRTVPPVLLKIYEKRKAYWWTRCVSHYQEFRERRRMYRLQL
jgi:hypothetical protein